MSATENSAALAEIVDLTHKGQAVAKLESGKVIFLDRGLPGERARIAINSKSRRYNRGRVLELVELSPDRRDPDCRHFDICGGCAWRDLDYPAQLRFKRKQVIDSLERIGKLVDAPVDEIVPAEPLNFYRNKMEFSFNRNPETPAGFNLGLHERGRYSRVFDVHDCLLQSPRSNAIIAWVREFAQRQGLPAYDVQEHTGYLRFLMIREGKRTGELMINLVTTTETLSCAEAFVSECRERFPEVTTIVQNMNDRRSNIAYGDREEILYGPGYIHEEILDRRFRVYANSFLQTNSYQTETLYRLALERAELRPTDRLFDLYCGAGTIGICAASQVAEVVGIELEASAIQAALENAELNGVSNACFLSGGVRETLRERRDELRSADVMIIDPPRAGMHPRAIYHASRFQARRIVYVSCSPPAFARDAALFAEQGYQLRRVIPVDMFPHTVHTELVAVFEPVS
ncbi:MAG TPA: 23S rRNA (uracil(1939)-C(5))-methyltransferase RlmD [candidate division Zixibacteria bacterium]|nr:23S rRNA (uracil(1939)-C(5))-methyltransferase RlmD [candidate division Zixibacteria bacterium]